MIGLVSTTAAGRTAAAELAAVLPSTTSYDVRRLADAFRECDALVVFLAVGATVRLLAPLLQDKATDPGVVCVDEGRQFSVALVGGHRGGANALAGQVGELLGARPVVTTATDAAGIPGLDTLGWPVEGDVAGVSRALLDGGTVVLAADQTWPLPPLPVVPPGALAAGPVLAVSDRIVEADAVLRPPSLVLGIGASKGVSAAELGALVDQTLDRHQLAAASVTTVATVDAKSAEPGILELCRERGWSLVPHSAELLAAVAVPNPSDAPLRAVGTPSVAEAAASRHGDLVVEKTRSARATVAVARVRPRGRLSVVGLGPGARDLLTPRAVSALRASAVWVGLDQYVEQVVDLARPGTRFVATGLGREQERAESAVAEATAGHAVALLGSGDAQVYAMASPALETAGADIDIDVVPGVTAALAAAAVLGAPLGHDAASISLSDLHTPWPAIEARVRAAAEGDLVVSFYNPRSRDRDWQLPKALGILSEHRPASTPVGIVTNASRPTEQVHLTTLAELDVELVGMYSLVTVGSSQSTVVAGRFVTPRGYRWLA